MQPDIRLIEVSLSGRYLHVVRQDEGELPIYIGLIDGQPCVRSANKADAMRRLLQMAGKGDRRPKAPTGGP